nr:reverse transcriptase domain-containing protein [Tanacetum cinerariifolium]
MKAQYGKFLDMIRAVRINVPLVAVLAGMSNYGKVLKELVSNKHKLKQISSAILSDECLAMIQKKVPPKLRDPGSFLIPCTFSKTSSCNALSDLGASINLIPYSLYVKLSLETLKPTKISVRLADRSFQYPIGIAKNMLVEGDHFLDTADAVIRLKQKQHNLGVGSEHSAGMRLQHRRLYLHLKVNDKQQIWTNRALSFVDSKNLLDMFPAQSVRPSNAYALDSPYLLVLNTETSKSRQHDMSRFKLRRTSLTGFPAQSIRSSNAIALDSLYLLVLITGTSQSRQHVDTSLIHLESRKSPTAELFDVDSERISIHQCEY